MKYVCLSARRFCLLELIPIVYSQLRWASIRLAEARAQVSSVVNDISGLRSIPKLRHETNAPLQEAVKVPVDKEGKKVRVTLATGYVK